jgi:hypothetical protein
MCLFFRFACFIDVFMGYGLIPDLYYFVVLQAGVQLLGRPQDDTSTAAVVSVCPKLRNHTQLFGEGHADCLRNIPRYKNDK